MPYEIYLAHHGVDGQKWGVKHGPPYPLKKGGIKKAKKKFAEVRKSLKEKRDAQTEKDTKELLNPSHPVAKAAKKSYISDEEYRKIIKESGADPYFVGIALDETLRERAKKIKKGDYSDYVSDLNKNVSSVKELNANMDEMDKLFPKVQEANRIRRLYNDGKVDLTWEQSKAVDEVIVKNQNLHQRHAELWKKSQEDVEKFLDGYFGAYGDDKFLDFKGSKRFPTKRYSVKTVASTKSWD